MKTPVICISIGDYNGVGPEVTLKALHKTNIRNKARIVIIGHPEILQYYKQCWPDADIPEISDLRTVPEPTGVYQYSVTDKKPDITPGALTADAGNLAMMAVQKAALACLNGDAQAMVTAPISKEAINKAGYNVPGHTEFLAEICKTDSFVMMLVNSLPLRVALVTIHEPLANVPALIQKESIGKTLSVVYQSIKNDFGIAEPKLAVLGLNPHAGDGGVLGREETDIITPAISASNNNGIHCEGPFPADGFFANQLWKQYDAVVAMYHDQGLIPFKTLSFNSGVNVTVGLPIIRTSPDHGTAFGIAGQNKANEGSFIEALELACEMALKRQQRNAG